MNKEVGMERGRSKVASKNTNAIVKERVAHSMTSMLPFSMAVCHRQCPIQNDHHGHSVVALVVVIRATATTNLLTLLPFFICRICMKCIFSKMKVNVPVDSKCPFITLHIIQCVFSLLCVQNK